MVGGVLSGCDAIRRAVRGECDRVFQLVAIRQCCHAPEWPAHRARCDRVLEGKSYLWFAYSENCVYLHRECYLN